MFFTDLVIVFVIEDFFKSIIGRITPSYKFIWPFSLEREANGKLKGRGLCY